MTRYLLLGLLGCGLLVSSWASDSQAVCTAQTSASTYTEGTTLADPPCDLNGNQYTTLGTLLNIEIPAPPVFWISTGTSTDEHAVCTGPCRIESILAGSTSATASFLNCENDTAANTVPGSETTTEFSMVIPGATTGAGFMGAFPVGKYFSNALTCWLVTDEALTGTTAVAANKIRLNYDVKLCAVGAVYPQC